MITLYSLPSLWGLPSISPHCMELETWLRLANLSYLKTSDRLERAPKKKLPFIEYSDCRIGDSTLIIQHLNQVFGVDLDNGLTVSQRATSLALRRMLKENTYWGIIHIRYGQDDNWERYRKTLAQVMVPHLQARDCQPLLDTLRERILMQMYGQGIGRHSWDEICQITCEDFQALSDILGTKPFFMGDYPTMLDATAYALVANTIYPPYQSQIVSYVNELENLCEHCDRMTERYFNTEDCQSHQLPLETVERSFDYLSAPRLQ